ncbi:MAG: pyridoxamine 5'-phosphate oxidase family protein, partial [Micrococcales bacterium]|nr:pyridoxamine 5'-phosphate oxidase family protein [Micrococcales bacterium]
MASRPLVSVRHRERMCDDRAQLDALLDATTIAHVAYVDDQGRPCVMPTSIARWADRVVIHGSTGSRWLRAVADGRPVAVSVAELTAVVVGHTSFQTGVHARSAVLYGQLQTLAGEEKAAALAIMLDRHLPGRSTEVRRPTK